jgi:hypothetical protein
MKKMSLFVVLMVIGALVLTACGASPAQPSGGGAPAPGVGTAQPTAKSNPNNAQPTPTAAAPTKTAAAPKSTDASSGNVELQDVTEGLASLDSYQSTFVMSFEGKDKDGKPVASNLAFEEAYQKNPPAKRTKYSGLGTSSTTANLADNTTEIIEVGGKSYFMLGTTCTSSDSSEAPTATSNFSPSGVMGGVKSSQLIGTENINGVSAKHYALDVASLVTLGAYANAKGEAWIADQGNFVVKYTFEATGQNALFGGSDGSEGTIKWNYEVTSINQPVNIVAPDKCGNAAEDIPMMADATDKFASGGMSTYTTASALKDVIDFYTKGMKDNGWSPKDDSLVQDAFATMSFTKDNRTVSIMLNFDPDKKTTSVVITEQK